VALLDVLFRIFIGSLVIGALVAAGVWYWGPRVNARSRGRVKPWRGRCAFGTNCRALLPYDLETGKPPIKCATCPFVER
jgi:hypothetical protein